MLPPAQVFPIPTITAGQQVYLGPAVLYGWAFEETTTSAVARLNLYDGTANTGKLVVPISLSADQSTRDYLPGNGVEIRTGVFLDVTAGSIDGSVWIVPLTFNEDIAFAFGQNGPFFAKDV